VAYVRSWEGTRQAPPDALSAAQPRWPPARRSAPVGAGPPGAGNGRPRPGGNATRKSRRCSRRH